MSKFNNKEIKNQQEKEKREFIENLINDTVSDFERRREERLSFERQWELNMNFVKGNQYSYIDNKGDLADEDKEYFWSYRGVYNHIAPLIETRLAKFARVMPIVSVRPKSDDDSDIKNASLAEKLLEGGFNKAGIVEKVKKVTEWSEICGTGFYKIIWNENGGNVIGLLSGVPVREGEIEIIPVSPFEIYPDNLSSERLEDCFSIIHAKAVSTKAVYEKYGVLLKGEDIDYILSKGKEFKGVKSKKKKELNSVLVIEKYERPSNDYPKGRLIVVAGGELLYYGELPYENGVDKIATFPFVKQESITMPSCFFGTSLVERLIPVQRAYNAVKNRKHEFINRLSSGVLTVEDGSIDVDDLVDDGLSPGKVLVYRQGSKAPEVMSMAPVPEEFSREEERLLNEFVVVSGVSDVASSSENATVSSGSALEILIEQDNERLMVTAEHIRNCYLEIARQVLHLYYQFIKGAKIIKTNDDFNNTKIYYADKNSAASDDVFIQSENELMYTPTQKKNMILDLYKSGILLDEEGKMAPLVKEKVLALLGYKDLDGKKNLSRLQEEKASKENEILKSHALSTDEIDDHSVHIDEHTRFVLSELDDLSEKAKERVSMHVKEHKEKLNSLNKAE